MTTDALSEILATMKLQGAVFFRGDFAAPWYTSTPESSQLARALSASASRLVVFHLLIDG
jgi:hypothetical protein